MTTHSSAPGAAPEAPIAPFIAQLKSTDARARESGAASIFAQGRALAGAAIAPWLKDSAMKGCLQFAAGEDFPEMVVGVAVDPVAFEEIRKAVGNAHLADVPPDQDALEFELEFPAGVKLDVLTSREPGGSGAIAKYLQKFGAGIQQIEILSHDVNRATQVLHSNFALGPIYPETRRGAGGTLINFFLVPAGGKKVLIEIVQEPPRK